MMFLLQVPRLNIVLTDQNLSLQAEPNLLDQVLINFLVNAMEAVKDCPDPEITLSSSIGLSLCKQILMLHRDT